MELPEDHSKSVGPLMRRDASSPSPSDRETECVSLKRRQSLVEEVRPSRVVTNFEDSRNLFQQPDKLSSVDDNKLKSVLAKKDKQIDVLVNELSDLHSALNRNQALLQIVNKYIERSITIGTR